VRGERLMGEEPRAQVLLDIGEQRAIPDLSIAGRKKPVSGLRIVFMQLGAVTGFLPGGVSVDSRFRPV
jgi:hypothetical protein